ncbi:acyl-CoA transferase [Pedobacter lusitanus]|uniref:Acyl-CoA transferase n=1 Tax=Pedobacter lusitanus TaxID=1503925 RepID=A0A0D0GDA3_9SPHI|nr:CaiB/BaiF CoA-transferase family protein [Pedobacter lusitanus]KIO75292.1 acyl-CoA transferase [Pedobacter lusitanus]
MNLLDDLLVLDFSQFLSGPSASLRLADLGARVIKIEKPVIGDICRTLYVSDVEVAGESTIFHAINRNKESLIIDLKDKQGLEKIIGLVRKADVLIHNFRPGVMERIGLSYAFVKSINAGIIYAEISGYGENGEWKDKPGQDLLLQAVSGLTYLSGNKHDNPTPMGVAVADILAGTHLVQGILAALYKKGWSGEGSQVKVSMLESLIDFQFEVLTSFYNDGEQLQERGEVNNANSYMSAPYGVYRTKDSAIALSINRVDYLGELLNCSALKKYNEADNWFVCRDEIKTILQNLLLENTVAYWLSILEPAGVWCSAVFNYVELMEQEGYKILEMEQIVELNSGQLKTTRCPIRVDGRILYSSVGAPSLGQHTKAIEEEFNL